MRLTALTRFIATAAVAMPMAFSSFAQVSPHGGMMRFPDISSEHIVFVYANDLWVVPRTGGEARPLASPPGGEMYPKFSADGQTIAFIGNYDGGRDLYTIPVLGGIPSRLTHHPANESLCDWTPDGRLLFNTNGLAGLQRQQQLFFVGANGGLPEQVSVPYGERGAVSEDGTWLAYTPMNRDFRTWKRYRGGLASDIWLFNLNTKQSRRVTTWEGTDTQPMWHKGTLYYLSDEGGQARLNLWSFDPASGRRAQITTYTDFDVKWPSIGPGPNGQGEIVFQYGSELRVIDLGTKNIRTVDVTIPGDRPQLRTQSVDASNFVTGMAISSTGKRAAVEARGDIWTTPAENGAPRNLTRTDGAAERDPSWSPDGRWIAYFSDATGEYELYVTQSDGQGETKQLTKDSKTFYYRPTWSPDSKHIAFSDKAGYMFLYSFESGETKQFDRDVWGNQPAMNFSHDSRWITYSKANEENPQSSVFIYDTKNDELHRVTSVMFDDQSPVFDRKGEWLYFASTRNFSPSYSNLDTTFIYDDAQVLIAVPLRDDVKSPWLAKSDEESWKDEKKKDDAADSGDDAAASNDKPAAAPAKADDGVSGAWSGTVNVPDMPQPLAFTMNLTLGANNQVTGSMNAGPFSGPMSGSYDPASKKLKLTLTGGDGTVVTFDMTIEGSTMRGNAFGPDGQAVPITATRASTGGQDTADAGNAKADDKPAESVEIDFDGFEARAMMIPVPSGVFGNLAVNSSNQLLFVRRSGSGGNGIKLFDLNDSTKSEKDVATGVMGFDISADGKQLLLARGRNSAIQPASPGGAPKNLKTDGMTARINPREEWRQIFVDAWRIQRDFFYDPNLHGVDWPAIRKQYEAMLADCVNREDVSYVISEMISELNVGHAYYWGGDTESQPSVSVGLLGVDFTLENGAYRISKIYRGADWDVDATGPLSEPGIDVNEGDYLLAVNGVPMNTAVDPWAPFTGKVGHTVTLTVSDQPTMNDEAREVIIKPIGSEADLRYRAWIERNRAYVEEQTGGKVGYIYVPDTGVNGQNNLFRQFYGQAHKEALIIDERWNGGGQIPTRFIELLNRPVTNYWARSNGKDWKWPPDAHHGPKCMLINGPSGSGGDAFPYYFKQAGLGKLIGTRTWGGLVGISGNPGLVDGGYTAVPTFGFYENDGTWGIEGHGVDPDIEIIDDPANMQNGADPQLDRAIQLMLEEIRRNPYVAPKRPDYPNRKGMGITEDDK